MGRNGSREKERRNLDTGIKTKKTKDGKRKKKKAKTVNREP
jgi:hypothetical protein